MKRFCRTLFVCGLLAVACSLSLPARAASTDAEGADIANGLFNQIKAWAEARCSGVSTFTCINGQARAVANQVYRLAWNTSVAECPISNAPACAEGEEAVVIGVKDGACPQDIFECRPVEDPAVQCPVYNAPACADDEVAVANPPRENGCSGGMSCKKKTLLDGPSCPQYQRPLCLDNEVVAYRPNGACPPMPYCASATETNNGGIHTGRAPFGFIGGSTPDGNLINRGTTTPSGNVGSGFTRNGTEGRGITGNAPDLITRPAVAPSTTFTRREGATRPATQPERNGTRRIGGNEDRAVACPMIAAINPTCASGQTLTDPQPNNPCKQTYPWVCSSAGISQDSAPGF